MHKYSMAALFTLLAASSVPRWAAAADPTFTSKARPATEVVAPNQMRTVPKSVNPTSDRASAPSAPRVATNEERATYAAREAASPDAKKYKGGDDVIVIGAGTTALILGIVLLVVLL
jgi:hypothetical protein